MGWWNDEEEPFNEQWNNLNNHLSNKKTYGLWAILTVTQMKSTADIIS